MTKKNQYLFVLAIPIINAIAANTTGFMPDSAINPGAIRAFLVGTFSLFFLFKRLPDNKLNVFILFYLAYFFILTLTSTDILFSLNLYIKLYLGVIMFPIGYYYINNKEKMGDLIKVFLYALVIYIINIAISNIFKLGSSDYLDDSFYFGSGRVNITKSMLLLVYFAPLTFFFYKKKWLIGIIYIIGLLIAVIGIKRSVLLSGISAVLIYAYFKQNKTYLIKGVMGLFLIIGLLPIFFPSYTDTFLARFEAREERIDVTEESLDKEARYNETFQVINAWVNGSVKHKLFGSELFNDRYFFGSFRMLHTDYMIMLNGSGVVGCFFWFFIFWLIIKEKNKYYRYLRNDEFYREMNTIFYIFLVSQIIMSISSTVYAIDIRCIFFLYWGAMVGTMRSRYYELRSMGLINR